MDWIEQNPDSGAVDALVAAGEPPLVARLLAVRGVTPETLPTFLSPKPCDLADASELPGARAAAAGIAAAARAGRKIVVFGDYDCDGVCATAILVRVLSCLGWKAFPFLPERLTEGYGLTEASVSRLLSEHPDVGLVVTVDNGVNAVEAVAGLKSRGIDVIVTDHHLPGPDLPGCLVVDPKVAAPPHLTGLCAAGVALLVARAIIDIAKSGGRDPGGSVSGPLIVLAGLATVTDIMPLTDQNRVIVSSALRNFWRCAPVGLKELLVRAARRASAAPTSRDFGFLIGPRVNAAGRLGSAMEALRLVLATDREEARERAMQIDLRNTERKNVEVAMTEAAVAQVVPDAPAQVIDIPDGHPGVAGIVAARLVDRLSRTTARGPVPVCVAVGPHGSARAPEGYNVRDAFAACSDYLTRFGGHAAAGGFSVREGMMDAFRAAFAEACAAQAAGAAVRPGVMKFDAEVSARDLTLGFVESLSRLEPFGEGNQCPVFAIRGVVLADAKPIGADGRHLGLYFRGGVPDAVWLKHGYLAEELRAGSGVPRDLLFTAEVSTYGEDHVELRVVDLH